MALTSIQICRLQVGDTDPALPFLSDETYQYYLDKNAGNIDTASLEAARAILFQLSTQSDETVSIFSVRGSTAAKTYRETLQFYLANPGANPFLSKVQPYASGISRQDMKDNLNTADNNAIRPVNQTELDPRYDAFNEFAGNPFYFKP